MDWNCVPLWLTSEWSRLQLIADTYGGFTPQQILRAVRERIELMLNGISAAAAAGDMGMRNLIAVGEPHARGDR